MLFGIGEVTNVEMTIGFFINSTYTIMKLNVFALFMMIGLLGMTSCNKEKKQERNIEGIWTVQTATFTVGEIITNPFDNPDAAIELKYIFGGDRQFQIDLTTTPTGGEATVDSRRGTWDILDEQLILDYTDSNGLIMTNETSETYEIKNLTEKALSLEIINESTTVNIDAIQ